MLEFNNVLNWQSYNKTFDKEAIKVLRREKNDFSFLFSKSCASLCNDLSTVTIKIISSYHMIRFYPFRVFTDIPKNKNRY